MAEFGKCFTLPFLTHGRRLDDPIFKPLKYFRATLAQPGKNVAGEMAAMSAGFNNLDRTRLGFALCQPFHELKSEQFAEQLSDADTRVKIARSANRVLFLFIISINRTINGQAHERFEWDRPSLLDLGCDYFKKLSQRFGRWCGFSY